MHRFSGLVVAVVLGVILDSPSGAAEQAIRVATFSADVTIPLGHRCMGILPTKAERIDDPLEANGLVLLGSGSPVVLVALDWCELRNGSYDRWRDALAEAAGTTPERVLVCCLHQHDAPVVDADAQALLDEVGLEKELCDVAFNEECIGRVAEALHASLDRSRQVTHLGVGEAKVERVASSRRVVLADGKVTFDRASGSGGNPIYADAADGEIDPFLKTLSLWDGETPVAAIHAYAVHPMSVYGRGGVSADFVGLARRRRAADDPSVPQIYVSGCSGDVTAGKYNDASPAMRGVLADRVHTAMTQAWKNVRRSPLREIGFRVAEVDLPFHEGGEFTRDVMTRTLRDPKAAVADRILAAMGLASLDRVERGEAIDLPCVDLGAAQLVLFPGESFVAYQLAAQQLRPDSFVFCAGYGECWPGYVPTRAAFDDGFDHGWRWCGPESDERLHEALEMVLGKRAEK